MAAPKGQTLISPPITIFPKQSEFIESEARWDLFVGGRGSGKTWSGIIKAMREAGRRRCTGACVAPTYGMLHDGLLQLFFQIVPEGMIKEFSKARMVATLTNGSRIFFRSGDEPDRLRGLNLSWLWLDEACYMDALIWPIATATLREDGRAGRAFATTTPKGYDWVYETFVENATKDHHMVQCSTHDNIFTSKEFRSDVAAAHGGGWFADQEISGAFVEAGGGINVDRVRVLNDRPVLRDWIRYWDTAATKQDGDYTVGALLGRMRDNSWVIAEIIRGQWSPSEIEVILATTAERDGRTVKIRIEQEPGGSGVQIIDVYKNLLHKFDCMGDKSSGSKATRIQPFAAQLEAGGVSVVKGPWNKTFFKECRTYNPGEKSSRKRKDDQLDACAGAFYCLGNNIWTSYGYQTVSKRRIGRSGSGNTRSGIKRSRQLGQGVRL